MIRPLLCVVVIDHPGTWASLEGRLIEMAVNGLADEWDEKELDRCYVVCYVEHKGG